MPGIGKTQLCMQLALDAQIPSQLSGVQGSTVYIDTEGSLSVERMQQMAQAVYKQLSAVTKVREVPRNPQHPHATGRHAEQ